MKDSLILGASFGSGLGAATGASTGGSRSENAIKGTVIGGIIGAIAAYFIHEALETRDNEVRRSTLMDLETYNVLGVPKSQQTSQPSTEDCRTTRMVDGKFVSIPCRIDGKERSLK